MHDPSLCALVQSLPKTETHLHIEGALPYDELLRPLDPKRFPERPLFRERRYRYPTFADFEQVLLDHALVWFTSAERYHEAARVTFAKHVQQNVRYVETSFHLPVVGFINVPGPEIIEAIRSAAPPGLEVRVFAGMSRDNYATLKDTIDQVHRWEHLAGIDLHGPESLPTESWTAPVWRRARDAGKVLKCHAGEFSGAYRVREAIEMLGALRIQHGVRAIEDPEVVRLAADRGATFDVCPLSNVGLRVFPSIATHPLRELGRAGIRCTISTDDPLSFGNSLAEEYRALVEQGGFSKAEIVQLVKNGWEVASISGQARAARMAEIDRLSA